MENIFKNRLHEITSIENKKKDYIIYWMQSAQRYTYNHSLAYSIKKANELNKHLLVVFCLTDSYQEANQRHYKFMLEGLLELKHVFKNKDIPFIILKGDILKTVRDLSKHAYMMITDFGYQKIHKQWYKKLSKTIHTKLIAVETNLIVPITQASNKEEYAAYTIRKKINTQLSNYAYRFIIPKLKVNSPLPKFLDNFNSINLITVEQTLSTMNLDQSIETSSDYIGGYKKAMKRLEFFINNHLSMYSKESNDPVKNMTSHLSPYIHFGQISTLEIYNLVSTSQYLQEADDFLEQLIVRRELSFNFIYYNKTYDSNLFQLLPNWAVKTLKNHESDPKLITYKLDQLEHAKTHDVYWNAAQLELTTTGLMHNYMRMYWGKKIIEWCNTYQEAFDHMIYLNNKYALDGRDANSYAGIAWCFGKHDRAWKEREIFGKIRYMNANGLKRKFDIDQYVNKYIIK